MLAKEKPCLNNIQNFQRIDIDSFIDMFTAYCVTRRWLLGPALTELVGRGTWQQAITVLCD